ncbi:zinc metalloprotease [Pyxidicoccus fallax]|uniref:Zinc metalloprotease n=1 Tax=Pyxidicoccus fallax TaxID=394095 RepID=A0A848LG43_9BACT|nr:zinc metalloprotease [Pyxidicoccus fallax]NMO16263.1 zinc metalloprotease [Pyxidicoccus fallax]NPC78666.1 zinc metalloprotease [Pyxidicoccus fallax]
MRKQVMKRGGTLALVVGSMLAWGCGGELEPMVDDAPTEAMAARCATEQPTEVNPGAERSVRAMRLPGSVRVPTYVHVLRSGTGLSNGDVPDSMVFEQLNVLNTAFRDTPFYFELQTITRTTNSTWFLMSPGSTAERNAKTTLRRGGKESLNLYTARPGGGLLGWATFPASYAGNPKNDGVVMLYTTLPGGTAAPYNEGDSTVHEVGHWLGLSHTSTGCTSDDGVADTPLAMPASVCADGRDTCVSPGLDPIHNYMGSMDDACIYEFTPGQAARMDNQALMYR